MQFRDEILAGIALGAINVAFRRLEPGAVRAGHTFVTGVGRLTVALIKPIDAETIREADAHRAGYPSREALLSELGPSASGLVYRIELVLTPG